MKIDVKIELDIVDDKYYYDILAPNELTLQEIRSIIAGALSLTIRGEKTPKSQGKALRGVIEYLEDEFINTESFADSESYIRDQDSSEDDSND